MKSHFLNVYFNTTKGVNSFRLSHDIKRALRESQIKNGLMALTVMGSKAGFVILDDDQDLIDQVPGCLDALMQDVECKNDEIKQKLKTSFLTPSISLSVKEGALVLSPWQEVVLFDLEDKNARREVIVQCLAEVSQQQQQG